ICPEAAGARRAVIGGTGSPTSFYLYALHVMRHLVACFSDEDPRTAGNRRRSRGGTMIWSKATRRVRSNTPSPSPSPGQMMSIMRETDELSRRDNREAEWTMAAGNVCG